MKSTRADVERLLGKPKSVVADFSATYLLEKEEVHILYAVREWCSADADGDNCLVPSAAVLEIAVTSRIKSKFSIIDINKAKFDKFPNAEDTSVMIYLNHEAGLIYAVSEKDDSVLYTQYAPAAKDREEILKKR